MGCDQHTLAAQHVRQDVLAVIGKSARDSVLQALAAGRGHVIAATPQMDLLLAPFLAGVVLVEPAKIAIIALVERLVPMLWQARLRHFGKREGKRMLCAGQRRSVGDVERDIYAL